MTKCSTCKHRLSGDYCTRFQIGRNQPQPCWFTRAVCDREGGHDPAWWVRLANWFEAMGLA